VAARSVGEKVALVAHAGTIDAAIRWALGLPPSTPWQHEFDLGNGSITEIKLWPDGRKAGGAPRFAVLRRVGDTAHLGELASDL
jgi:broad specificity phosphatase PhoE